MAKSTRDNAGVVFVLDEPDAIRRKISRAVTDGLNRVEYHPDEQPGVANLLDILAACQDKAPAELADGIDSYGALKDAVAEAVVEELRPVRESATALLADPVELDRIREAGAVRAREHGKHRLDSALRLAGLA